MRDAADVNLARELLRRAGSEARIVAKIERHEAIANLAGIIEASDVLMVARGDLGVEMGYAALTGLRMGTASATLAAGPLARFDVPGLLRQLDRYPYGCTEQITSRAMPLLYLDDVAVAMGLEQRNQLDKRIKEAVTMIMTTGMDSAPAASRQVRQPVASISPRPTSALTEIGMMPSAAASTTNAMMVRARLA